MVRTTGRDTKAPQPIIKAHFLQPPDMGNLRLMRMQELDAEFKRQARRLARMVNRLKKTHLS